MENQFSLILGGLGTNFLLMFASALLPLGIGVGLTFAMKHASSALRVVLRIVGVLFYCAPPVVLVLLYYFTFGGSFERSVSGFISAIAALTVSHLGYFLIHFDNNGSVKKNIIVNALGLFSSTFIWSLIMGYIGVREVVNSAQQIVGRTYEFSIYFVVLAIVFVILAAINIPRMILKEKLK